MIDMQRIGRSVGNITIVALCGEHGCACLRVRKRAERQRSDELLCGCGHHHANLMPLLAPVGGEMAGLESGDTAGYAKKNMSHSRVVLPLTLARLMKTASSIYRTG